MTARRAVSDCVVSAGEISPGRGHDRASIESSLHPHQRDTRLRFTLQDRRGHRRSPTVFGQDRGMEIEAAAFRDFENRLTKDQPVSRHQKQFGLLSAAVAGESIRPATWGLG